MTIKLRFTDLIILQEESSKDVKKSIQNFTNQSVINVDLKGETAYLYWKLNLFNPIFCCKKGRSWGLFTPYYANVCPVKCQKNDNFLSAHKRLVLSLYCHSTLLFLRE